MARLPSILSTVAGTPVKWVPAHENNRFDTDNGLEKEGVVLHIAEGTLAGCDSWFSNPIAIASANFCVGKYGEIHQYVELYGAAPFANGVALSETRKVNLMAQVVKELSQKHNWVSQNLWTWSIEHEGKSGDILTPAQFDASTKLTALLLGSLPPEKRRTFGHYQFDNVTRSRCPGWSTAQWTAYDERVTSLIAEAENPPPPPGPQSDLAQTIKPIVDAIYDHTHAAAVATEELFRLLRDNGVKV